jgi:hypothetical protein
MRLRRAASLWIAALMSATGVLADMKGVRNSPSFTGEEIGLIGGDPRLIDVAPRCARQLRQALDMLNDMSLGSRVGVVLEPCPAVTGGQGRASDEGALDILKILKEASEQGAGRSGRGDGAGGLAAGATPSFTSQEMELIYRDKRKRLIYAARRCPWQLRQALDSLHSGGRDLPPQRPCWVSSGESTRGTDEGALDILKILREASGESTKN